MRVLILGGTGVISRSITEQLINRNDEVVLFNRGSRTLPFMGKVRQIIGNRQNREEFEASMRKEKFDVVIDMICFNTEDAKSTVRAFRDNVEQIIICSSIAAYKRPYKTVPTIEEAEELWDNPVFGYAFEKAQMERYLNKAIKEERLPITIIRPSLTYGPGAANIGVLRQNYGIVDRIRKGKPLVMFGDGTTPWSFTFVPDLAKGFVGAAGNKKTYGEAYHITNEDRHIWDDLYLEFGKIVGKKPEIVHLPSEMLYKAAPNLCGHLYFEKTYAGLFDNSKVKRDIPGFKTEISLNQGLKIILDWYEKEANTVDSEKDELEDKLVGMYNQWSEQAANLYIK
ncbi:MAG: NAD-dependent epimerase/dehydratase family protein [Clostridia bacterium]